MPTMPRSVDNAVFERMARGVGEPKYPVQPYIEIVTYAVNQPNQAAQFDLSEGETPRQERRRVTVAAKTAAPGKRVRWLRANGVTQTFALVEPRDPNAPKRVRRTRAEIEAAKAAQASNNGNAPAEPRATRREQREAVATPA